MTRSLRIIVLILSIGVLVTGALAADHDWQQGTLLHLDLSTMPYTMGKAGYMPEHTVGVPIYTVAIQASGTVYTAQWRSRKAELTENAPIEWYLKKDTLVFKDERGKEFKAQLIKKRLEP